MKEQRKKVTMENEREADIHEQRKERIEEKKKGGGGSEI